jgi:hypothetical protein
MYKNAGKRQGTSPRGGSLSTRDILRRGGWCTRALARACFYSFIENRIDPGAESREYNSMPRWLQKEITALGGTAAWVKRFDRNGHRKLRGRILEDLRVSK